MPSYTSYMRQMAVLDADDNEIESWITVRGNHIPIKKGQSKEDAVKSFIEHQAGKNDTPQGVKWTPTNKKGEGTGNKSEQKKEKYDIRHGASIQNIENVINAYADEKAYKTWKEEEEFVAEKLKEEGFYAYGGQIKKAMKNVYGDVYTEEREEESKKDYTIAHKDKSGNTTIIAEVSHHDIGEKEDKAESSVRNDLGKFADAYNKLYNDSDAFSYKPSDLSKEYNKAMHNPEFAKWVQEMAKERGDVFMSDREYHALLVVAKEKGLIGEKKAPTSKKKKEPAIVREGGVNWVDPKAWNDPRSDPWYAVYE